MKVRDMKFNLTSIYGVLWDAKTGLKKFLKPHSLFLNTSQYSKGDKRIAVHGSAWQSLAGCSPGSRWAMFPGPPHQGGAHG